MPLEGLITYDTGTTRIRPQSKLKNLSTFDVLGYEQAEFAYVLGTVGACERRT